MQKTEMQAAWEITQRIFPFIWPAGDTVLRVRVVLALLALIGSKIIAILAPILQAWAVDDLAESNISDFILGAVGLTVAYGFARIMTSGFQQLRDVLFAKVAQRAFRRLALQTFHHIHKLSMRFHINRKTGGLSRIIERGVKGLEFLLRHLVFSTGPLVIELVFIGAVIFWKLQDWRYVAIIFITILVYVWFTFSVTEWRVKLRRKMNEEDTDANQKAVDSLLNFETVKYFNAEEREALRYDKSIAGYEEAALKTSYSLAFLNFGQAILVTVGLVGVMILAALGVQLGELTVGDFVLVNAYMIQIIIPPKGLYVDPSGVPLNIELTAVNVDGQWLVFRGLHGDPDFRLKLTLEEAAELYRIGYYEVSKVKTPKQAKNLSDEFLLLLDKTLDYRRKDHKD